MSIWYDDGDTQQWVPVSTAYNYDYDLDVVTASLNAEVRNRERAINALYARIAEIDSADLQEVQALQQQIAQVEAKLYAQPSINLQPYPLRTEVQSLTDALHARISELENSRLNPAELCTRAEFTPQLNAIEALLYSKVSSEELDEVASSIPDVSEFVRQQDINASIDAITVDYLPRNGGTVHGSFIVNKIYPDLPALDFSGTSYSSRSALKFKSNAPGDYTSSFGSTDPVSYTHLRAHETV